MLEIKTKYICHIGMCGLRHRKWIKYSKKKKIRKRKTKIYSEEKYNEQDWKYNLKTSENTKVRKMYNS